MVSKVPQSKATRMNYTKFDKKVKVPIRAKVNKVDKQTIYLLDYAKLHIASAEKLQDSKSYLASAMRFNSARTLYEKVIAKYPKPEYLEAYRTLTQSTIDMFYKVLGKGHTEQYEFRKKDPKKYAQIRQIQAELFAKLGDYKNSMHTTLDAISEGKGYLSDSQNDALYEKAINYAENLVPNIRTSLWVRSPKYPNPEGYFSYYEKKILLDYVLDLSLREAEFIKDPKNERTISSLFDANAYLFRRFKDMCQYGNGEAHFVKLIEFSQVIRRFEIFCSRNSLEIPKQLQDELKTYNKLIEYYTPNYVKQFRKY